MSADQLVAAAGDTQRLVNLATLSDSLDYLADAIQHFGDGHHTRTSALVCALPAPPPNDRNAFPGSTGLLAGVILQ